MRTVTPQVFLVAETVMYYPDLHKYLVEVGAGDWTTDAHSSAEALCEAAGRLCYRSWAPKLNPNVSKVREGNAAYLNNILSSRHGSVFEHSSVSFIFHHVSRVLTHELVRHRVGVGVSQESMRYVRLTNIPLVLGDGQREAEGLLQEYGLPREVLDQDVTAAMTIIDRIQNRLGAAMDASKAPFEVKKRVTSWMRRFVPMGVATDILWTANMRTLRHVLEQRTALGAEEEIRGVFDQVGRIVTERYPAIFQDFTRTEAGEWLPKHSKV